MIWLALVQVCTSSLAGADITAYPAPAGEAIAGDYAVTVNGKPVDVYAAQSEFFEGDYYFATFDFSGKVAVRVTSSQSLATAYNGHFECMCYHPLFLFNQFGDLEWAMLRRGNHHSAKFWRRVLLPVIERFVENTRTSGRAPALAVR